MRLLVALCGLTAAVSWGILLWLGWMHLMPESGGLLPFDLRATGYSLAEATAYLEALTTEGAVLIRGQIGTADTVFPISFALFLALICLRMRGRLRWLGVLLALAYGATDLLENAAILQMIDGPRSPDPLTVSGASLLTRVKFGLVALALLVAVMARLGGGRRR